MMTLRLTLVGILALAFTCGCSAEPENSGGKQEANVWFAKWRIENALEPSVVAAHYCPLLVAQACNPPANDPVQSSLSDNIRSSLVIDCQYTDICKQPAWWSAKDPSLALKLSLANATILRDQALWQLDTPAEPCLTQIQLGMLSTSSLKRNFELFAPQFVPASNFLTDNTFVAYEEQLFGTYSPLGMDLQEVGEVLAQSCKEKVAEEEDKEWVTVSNEADGECYDRVHFKAASGRKWCELAKNYLLENLPTILGVVIKDFVPFPGAILVQYVQQVSRTIVFIPFSADLLGESSLETNERYVGNPCINQDDAIQKEHASLWETIRKLVKAALKKCE